MGIRPGDVPGVSVLLFTLRGKFDESTGAVTVTKEYQRPIPEQLKVTYEGREMTVSQAPDSGGDIKMIDPSGFLALCAALPAMKELKDLKYALIRCRFPDVHSVR